MRGNAFVLALALLPVSFASQARAQVVRIGALSGPVGGCAAAAAKASPLANTFYPASTLANSELTKHLSAPASASAPSYSATPPVRVIRDAPAPKTDVVPAAVAGPGPKSRSGIWPSLKKLAGSFETGESFFDTYRQKRMAQQADAVLSSASPNQRRSYEDTKELVTLLLESTIANPAKKQFSKIEASIETGGSVRGTQVGPTCGFEALCNLFHVETESSLGNELQDLIPRVVPGYSKGEGISGLGLGVFMKWLAKKTGQVSVEIDREEITRWMELHRRPVLITISGHALVIGDPFRAVDERGESKIYFKTYDSNLKRGEHGYIDAHSLGRILGLAFGAIPASPTHG